MKLVGERRALASAVFFFYFIMYLLLVLLGFVPAGAEKAFLSIAGVYGLAFFALVAGYFWARWYAVGVGLFGVILGAVGLWQEGAEPQILFVGGTHLAATVMLWGEAMSKPYDGQTAWRERFHMDDNAVQRLGRSVIRAGVSLPFVLLYALIPRQDAGTGELLAGIVALCLTGLGVRALIQMKTWGVLALGVAGIMMTTLAGVDLASGQGVSVAALAGGLLLTAAVPFVTPMARWVAAR